MRVLGFIFLFLLVAGGGFVGGVYAVKKCPALNKNCCPCPCAKICHCAEAGLPCGCCDACPGHECCENLGLKHKNKK